MFLLRILIFKGPTARVLYKSFGVKGLIANGAFEFPLSKLLNKFVSCVNFWVVLRRIVFNSRRFGTLCLPSSRRVDSYPLAYEDGKDTVPKRRLLNTIRRRTTKKITHDIQSMAKAWNQEIHATFQIIYYVHFESVLSFCVPSKCTYTIHDITVTLLRHVSTWQCHISGRTGLSSVPMYTCHTGRGPRWIEDNNKWLNIYCHSSERHFWLYLIYFQMICFIHTQCLQNIRKFHILSKLLFGIKHLPANVENMVSS
jgi:hypothetical protein